jgi:hypothetical protein
MVYKERIMIYKGPELSTYWGDDEYKNRKATVMRNSHGYYVDMWESDQLVETRTLYEHSEIYAENAAENYVLGIMNP